MVCIFEHMRLRRPYRVVARLVLGFSLIPAQVVLAQQSDTPSTDAGQAVPTEGGGDLASKANDPSSPLKQLQFQDWYAPAYLGTQGESNAFLIRPVLPAQALAWFPSSITRPTIPVVSLPNGRSGLGDLSLFRSPFLSMFHSMASLGSARP